MNSNQSTASRRQCNDIFKGLKEKHLLNLEFYIQLNQGSPTPGPQTSTGPWPVRNWATQQEVSSG